MQSGDLMDRREVCVNEYEAIMPLDTSESFSRKERWPLESRVKPGKANEDSEGEEAVARIYFSRLSMRRRCIGRFIARMS